MGLDPRVGLTQARVKRILTQPNPTRQFLTHPHPYYGHGGSSTLSWGLGFCYSLLRACGLRCCAAYVGKSFGMSQTGFTKPLYSALSFPSWTELAGIRGSLFNNWRRCYKKCLTRFNSIQPKSINLEKNMRWNNMLWKNNRKYFNPSFWNRSAVSFHFAATTATRVTRPTQATTYGT